MRKFSELNARRSGTYFCVDKGVTSVAIKRVRWESSVLRLALLPLNVVKHLIISLLLVLIRNSMALLSMILEGHCLRFPRIQELKMNTSFLN
ncbi:hypothetical protein Ahy_A05g022317 isoform E [Arachis hypogaea]|uniref:Ferredoxin-thioredoxin reductase catalytic chain, chloroplastic n=1 Tax=Arachis hypogaea TaxID=3818 RepID=A0A445D093_ARAHY|nr:hypothetical protein Ahy_A05g022317 isoform E [Arachis hypogaea]